MRKSGNKIKVLLEGVIIMRVDIEIVCTPEDIFYDCPHCYCEVEIDYKDFSSKQISTYPVDWTFIVCPYCNEEFEIDEVDWI